MLSRVHIWQCRLRPEKHIGPPDDGVVSPVPRVLGCVFGFYRRTGSTVSCLAISSALLCSINVHVLSTKVEDFAMSGLEIDIPMKSMLVKKQASQSLILKGGSTFSVHWSPKCKCFH